MNGLLYKEFRQNRGVLITIAAVPLLSLILLPMFGFIDFGNLSAFSFARVWTDINDVPLLRMLMVLLGAFVIGFIVSLIFNADESKKWCYFAASLPGSAEKVIYTKYVFTFMVLGLFFLSQTFWEMVLQHTCYGACKIETSSLIYVFTVDFFVQLLFRAVEIPFFVRFGVKRGSSARLIAFFALIFLFMVWVLFGPLPDSFDELLDSLAALMLGAAEEQTQPNKLMEYGYLVLGFLPYAAVIAYVISYKISCKLYLKGAEQYEK